MDGAVRVVCRLAVPATIAVGLSTLATFIFRPVGPFDPEQRMYLLGNAINYVFAGIFQAVLFGFLFLISDSVRKGAPAQPPLLLGISLAALYLLIVACMVLLLRGFPEGQVLLPLGLMIVVFAWIGLVSGMRYSRRSFIEPRLD